MDKEHYPHLQGQIPISHSRLVSGNLLVVITCQPLADSRLLTVTLSKVLQFQSLHILSHSGTLNEETAENAF